MTKIIEMRVQFINYYQQLDFASLTREAGRSNMVLLKTGPEYTTVWINYNDNNADYVVLLRNWLEQRGTILSEEEKPYV